MAAQPTITVSVDLTPVIASLEQFRDSLDRDIRELKSIQTGNEEVRDE